MKKILVLLSFLAIAPHIYAQTPLPEPLRLWFDVSFNDSLHVLTMRPRLYNQTASSLSYYYQIRITDATLRPGDLREKISGQLFVAPFDTATILEKEIPYQVAEDFNVFLYILEEEFVVADTYWNFDAAYSAFKQKQAKPKAQPAYMSKDNFEIDGLVLNETKTPFGREFHRKFMEYWQAPKGASGYWITIRELLTPGRYTLLSVSLNNRELFQRYLVPRPEYIADLADQSVNYLASLLQNGIYDGTIGSDELFGKMEVDAANGIDKM